MAFLKKRQTRGGILKFSRAGQRREPLYGKVAFLEGEGKEDGPVRCIQCRGKSSQYYLILFQSLNLKKALD